MGLKEPNSIVIQSSLLLCVCGQMPNFYLGVVAHQELFLEWLSTSIVLELMLYKQMHHILHNIFPAIDNFSTMSYSGFRAKAAGMLELQLGHAQSPFLL